MEFKEVIKIRRSTRAFASRNISKKMIIDILELARLAPSAANRQPWQFVVLEGEKKNEIANILESDISDKEILNINFATKEYIPTASLMNSIRIIREAPILILAFRPNDEDWIEGDYLSIGAAVEHIHLAATNLGLGSIWLRDIIYQRNKIKKLLKYNNKDLVTAIVIGYSIEKPYQIKRKELSDIVKWIS